MASKLDYNSGYSRVCIKQRDYVTDKTIITLILYYALLASLGDSLHRDVVELNADYVKPG